MICSKNPADLFYNYSNTRFLPFDRNNKLKNLYLFLQEDSIQNIPFTNGLNNPLENYYQLRQHSHSSSKTHIFRLDSKSPAASRIKIWHIETFCATQKSIIKASFDFDQMHRRLSNLSLSFIFGLFNFLLFRV